jgi:AcrR family transcriptional regulator
MLADKKPMDSKIRDKVSPSRVEKFEERRAELSEAALQTLATLGYARTSLRDIAQNSEFSHGVLHYYFKDKVDLIVCSVRQYKARCVTRYDEFTFGATSYNGLMADFLAAFCATLRDDASMHRLWYDLRSQSLFEPAFRDDVAEIDRSLEQMIARIMHRFADLAGSKPRLSDAGLYALFDGLFQHALTRFLAGAPDALTTLRDEAEAAVRTLIVPAHTDA